MKLVQSTIGLVLSRIRFDWKRHTVAVVAVAILMANFLAFNALATGMEEGLAATLTEGRHDEIQLTLSGFGERQGTMDEGRFEELIAEPGILGASARSARSIGLDARNSTGPGGIELRFETILVGIDPRAESSLVVSVAPGTEIPAPFSRGLGYHARDYPLLEGSWILGPSDAVVTRAATEAGHRIGSEIVTPDRTYTVVGVIAHAPPFTVPGVIPSGHVLVDGETQEWPSILGAYFKLEPDFALIHAFTSKLIEDHPMATGSLQASLNELDRQFFEEARTQQVLAVAARLMGLAGAATLFAMSLFLLIGERKSLGTMAALGFSRPRLASYMNQKMILLAITGAITGGIIGAFAIMMLPLPEMSFQFTPTISRATYTLAATQTLLAALAGSLVSFLITIRQDPIQALRVTE